MRKKLLDFTSRNRRITLILLLLLSTVAVSLPAQTIFYAVSSKSDTLFHLVLSDFSIDKDKLISLGGYDVVGATGLAVDPCNGDFYVLLKVVGQSSRLLCTMNKGNGKCNLRGDTGDKFSGLAFGVDGKLYGVTGDGANVQETLYELNKTTGVATHKMAFGNGDDGECIVLNIDDGFIYHASGLISQYQQVIDLKDTSITDISWTGFDYDEAHVMMQVHPDTFLLFNVDKEVSKFTLDGKSIATPHETTSELKGAVLDLTPFVESRIRLSADTISVCDTLTLTSCSVCASNHNWNFGDGNNGTGASVQHIYDSAGTYIIQLSAVSGALGTDVSTDTVVVTGPPFFPATIVENGSNPKCPNEVLTLEMPNISGGVYQWYNGVTPIGGATNWSYSVPGGGTYSATMFDSTSSSTGCAANSDTVTVTLNNLPSVNVSAGGPTSFCQGGSVMLTGSSGGTSQWYKNGVLIPGANSNTYSATQAGNYNMVKTNTNGCSDSAAVGQTITIFPLPIVNITPAGPHSICSSGSVTLTTTVPGATTYQWYQNGALLAGAGNNSYNANLTGNYNVVVTDGNTCSDSASSSVSLTVENTPTAAFTQSKDTLLKFENVSFTDGSSNATTYCWNFGDGDTSVVQSPTHNYSTNGNFTVTLIAKTVSCGNDTTTSMIFVKDSLVNVQGNILNEFNAKLLQNVPNPFSESTMIHFELPLSANVTLEVSDLLGRKLVTLIDEKLPKGAHKVAWTGTNELGIRVKPATYFYSLNVNGNMVSKKMVLMK